MRRLRKKVRTSVSEEASLTCFAPTSHRIAAQDSRVRSTLSQPARAWNSASRSFTTDCTAGICFVKSMRGVKRCIRCYQVLRRLECEFWPQDAWAIFVLLMKGEVGGAPRQGTLVSLGKRNLRRGSGLQGRARPTGEDVMSPKILWAAVLLIVAGMVAVDQRQALAGEIGGASGYKVLE